jgi:hypothetical protein
MRASLTHLLVRMLQEVARRRVLPVPLVRQALQHRVELIPLTR